jgi:hypothetical protein
MFITNKLRDTEGKVISLERFLDEVCRELGFIPNVHSPYHGNILVIYKLRELGQENKDLKARITALEVEIRRLSTALDNNRIARVKPGWNPIPPYISCPQCGSKPTRMIAHDTVDGWAFQWECENYCGILEEPIYEWPFVDEIANQADVEAAGFEVV